MCVRQRQRGARLDYSIELLRLSRVCFIVTAQLRCRQEFLLSAEIEKEAGRFGSAVTVFLLAYATRNRCPPTSISLIPMLRKNQCNIRRFLLSPDRSARLSFFRSLRIHRSRWDHHRFCKGDTRVSNTSLCSPSTHKSSYYSI
jgi:hypothetical protein